MAFKKDVHCKSIVPIRPMPNIGLTASAYYIKRLSVILDFLPCMPVLEAEI